MIAGLIIDMDGVLYIGRSLLPGAAGLVAYLEEKSIPYVLATNNASRTPHGFAQMLADLGLSVNPERIFTSAQATAQQLAKILPPGSPVYVIGEEGLLSPIREAGFVIDQDSPRVEAVVVGMDRQLTYQKLSRAALLIARGARFIGTNPDKTYPTPEGLVPGAGAILAALSTTTGVPAKIVGKPEPILFITALERLGVPASSAAVVGDRLETDVLGGQRAGLHTILVLTGVTRREHLQNSPIRPELVFDDLIGLLRWLREDRPAL